jgi:hypothetical protein
MHPGAVQDGRTLVVGYEQEEHRQCYAPPTQAAVNIPDCPQQAALDRRHRHIHGTRRWGRIRDVHGFSRSLSNASKLSISGFKQLQPTLRPISLPNADSSAQRSINGLQHADSELL